MTTMTEISRQNLGVLGKAFAAELAELGKKYGITISAAGGTYGGTSGTVRLKVDVIDAGNGKSGPESEFGRYAHWWGLKPEDFGRECIIAGERYTICGCNPNAPKYPLLGKRLYDGKVYRLTERAVTAGLLPRKAA